MTEIWEAKGYAHLAFKSQNLRDQASRLEKIDTNISASSIHVNDTNVDESTILSIAVNNIISGETIDENLNPNRQQSRNANETTLDTNLHTTSVQFSEETPPTMEADYSVIENASLNHQTRLKFLLILSWEGKFILPCDISVMTTGEGLSL